MPRYSVTLLSIALLFSMILSGCDATPPPIPPMNTATPNAVTPLIPITVSPTMPPIQDTPPSATSTPTSSTCKEKTGTIEKGIIYTRLIDKPMSYNVYLPPCYSFDASLRYPVLYLLHGQGSTEDQWIRIGAVSAADKIISLASAPPFIMVFPFDFSYKQPNEYKFEEVFVQLLIPQIDNDYRTKTDSTYRAIGGLSRGGAWALRIGTLHPELFGAIGGHSPAIFYVDEKPLTRRLLDIPAEYMPRIWLDAGDKDSEFSVIEPFEKFLSEKGIPHEWHEYIGWHEEKYWSAHVEEYLKWYALAWTR